MKSHRKRKLSPILYGVGFVVNNTLKYYRKSSPSGVEIIGEINKKKILFKRNFNWLLPYKPRIISLSHANDKITEMLALRDINNIGVQRSAF